MVGESCRDNCFAGPASADEASYVGKNREEFRDYLRILNTNWVLILVTTLTGVGSAAALWSLAIPLYETQPKVYVSVRNETQASGGLLQGPNFVRQNIATFVQLATTESVLEPVAHELGIERLGAALGPIQVWSLYPQAQRISKV